MQIASTLIYINFYCTVGYCDRYGFESWIPPTGETDKSFKPYLLHMGTLKPVLKDSSTPIDFKNDLFEGKALFLANSAVTGFEGIKYTFEVQVTIMIQNLTSL